MFLYISLRITHNQIIKITYAKAKVNLEITSAYIISI